MTSSHHLCIAIRLPEDALGCRGGSDGYVLVNIASPTAEEHILLSRCTGANASDDQLLHAAVASYLWHVHADRDRVCLVSQVDQFTHTLKGEVVTKTTLARWLLHYQLEKLQESQAFVDAIMARFDQATVHQPAPASDNGV